MADITGPTAKAMSKMADKWKEYIRDGSHVKPLAPATVAAKIAKGSSYPDTPLIDTEQMVEAIESGVEGDNMEVTGYVTIRDPARAEIAVIHEYGLGPPARPTLRPCWDANADNLLEEIFDDVFSQIIDEF